ncbi:MAG: hypothetical protein QG608_419 [Actinomycetota bacterium]|nr:hypothetical protein [Actinomycetota bacterium]
MSEDAAVCEDTAVPGCPEAAGVPGGLDHLEHLRRESERFLAAIDQAPSGERVPTCPDWDVDDLLWHLAEVQWFWTEIVRTQATDPQAADAAIPARPQDRTGLDTFFATVSAELHLLLAGTDPADPAWNWSGANQTTQFVRRRQAHEALIHRVDAELAAGERTAIDPLLAADGIDEVLRIVHGGIPPWGSTAPYEEGTAVRLCAKDTGRTWVCAIDRFVGTSPTTGVEFDRPALQVLADEGCAVDATLTGTAADLDCFLWNRPAEGQILRQGSAGLLARLDELLAEGMG